MKIVKRLFFDTLHRNSLFLIINQIAGAGLGFLFWLIVARFYPSDEIGLASALISAMMFIAVLSTLGYDIAIIRFLPITEKKSTLINTCFTLGSVLSIGISVIFLFGLNFFSPELLFVKENVLYFFAFILFTAATTVGILGGEVFVAFRQTHYAVLQSIVGGVKLLLAAVIVGIGAFGIFSSWSIATCLSVITTLVFIVMLYRGYKPIPAVDRQMVKDMARFSWSNYIARVLEALPMRVMPLIIIATIDTSASAYFFITLSLSNILGMISGSATKSLFAEGSHDPAMLVRQMVKSIRFSLVLLVPAILVYVLFGDKILILYGAEYSENGFWLIRLLALSWLPAMISQYYISILRVQMRMKPLILIFFCTAVLIVGLSALMINWVGLTGIGIAWLITQCLVAIGVTPGLIRFWKSNKDVAAQGGNDE